MKFDSLEIDFRDFEVKDKSQILEWLTEANPQSEISNYISKFDELIKSDESKIIIATHNNVLIGFVAGHVDMQSKVGILNLIYVTPEYRGNYLGKELLNLLEDGFKDKGCKTAISINIKDESILEFLKGMNYQSENRLSKTLN